MIHEATAIIDFMVTYTNEVMLQRHIELETAHFLYFGLKLCEQHLKELEGKIDESIMILRFQHCSLKIDRSRQEGKKRLEQH